MRIWAIVGLIFGLQNALAADPVAIMTEAFEGDDAKSTIALMDMTLKSAKGGTQPRKLKMEQLGSKAQLMWFLSPNDLRGTAFLSTKEGDDERMWLYMPAFKVTNRISGKRKKDSFMGSEFTYEDMAKRETEDYTWTYIKEGQYDGKKVHIIDGVAKDEDSSYSKTTFYIDIATKDLLQAEMYGKNGQKFKVMQNQKIDVIDGTRVPSQIVMKNLIDGDETEIILRDIKLNTSVPENHFTERYMQRVR